jgi:hypothetical protein
MKSLFVLLLSCLFAVNIYCQDSTSANSHSRDTLSTDILSGKPMLLGYARRTDLTQDTSFSWWFNSMYDSYNIDTTALAGVANALDSVNVRIVMGTWCSDSRMQVPRFYRILDYLHYPENKVSLLMVGRDKKGMRNETDSLDIQLVPTFIFYKNGKELGRIVEEPKVSLEKDMAGIVGKK